jgi:ATP-dependent Clp protease adapter protein ClpS
VVLYNDDHNEFGYVIGCLMVVFRHSESLARKVATEAHEKGRAVAEVEEMEKAREHATMLGAMGLRAEAEGF